MPGKISPTLRTRNRGYTQPGGMMEETTTEAVTPVKAKPLKPVKKRRAKRVARRGQKAKSKKE